MCYRRHMIDALVFIKSRYWTGIWHPYYDAIPHVQLHLYHAAKTVGDHLFFYLCFRKPSSATTILQLLWPSGRSYGAPSGDLLFCGTSCVATRKGLEMGATGRGVFGLLSLLLEMLQE